MTIICLVVMQRISYHTAIFLVLYMLKWGCFCQDMAAHSACDFGGGKAEKLALAKYRQVIWQGRVLNSQFTDEELRSRGRCPLTPEEIGLLLAALGFDNSTRLYLASHKVWNKYQPRLWVSFFGSFCLKLSPLNFVFMSSCFRYTVGKLGSQPCGVCFLLWRTKRVWRLQKNELKSKERLHCWPQLITTSACIVISSFPLHPGICTMLW